MVTAGQLSFYQMCKSYFNVFCFCRYLVIWKHFYPIISTDSEKDIVLDIVFQQFLRNRNQPKKITFSTDLSKLCDSLYHELLLTKLHAYGSVLVH